MGERYLLKRLQFAVNLQAHPSGLRAFPELNGSFWCLPSGNPTSTTLPLAEEAVPQNSDPKMLDFYTACHIVGLVLFGPVAVWRGFPAGTLVPFCVVWSVLFPC